MRSHFCLPRLNWPSPSGGGPFLPEAVLSNPWANEEHVEELKKLWKEGKSCSECAKILNRKFKLGITRNSIIGKVHRLGLGGRARKVSQANFQRAKRRLAKRQKKGREQAMKRNDPFAQLVALPLPEEPADEIARTTILEREKDQCAWIIGPPHEMKCCGAPIMPGLPNPWCLDHARRGYDLPRVAKRGPFILRDLSSTNADKPDEERGKEAACCTSCI